MDTRSTHFTGRFFEIPLERILVHPVAWYRWEAMRVNGAPGADVAAAPPVEEFEPFDASRHRPLEDVPAGHEDYLREARRRGERPLRFVHVPHVLVGGPIDVSNLRVVSWEHPPET